jgi:hypothetical protein
VACRCRRSAISSGTRRSPRPSGRQPDDRIAPGCRATARAWTDLRFIQPARGGDRV